MSPATAELPETTEQAAAARRRRSAPHARVCKHCCNDGEHYVPCLDVDACAAKASRSGRYALVNVHVGVPRWPWLTSADSLRAQADAVARETNSTVDLLLIMLKTDAKKLGCKQRLVIARYGIKVVEVPWALPPTLRWHPKYWSPGSAVGWCGPMDLVRLHVLAMEEYDAVAFYDQDIEFQGDVMPVLRCASTGLFLSTSGGIGEPLNVGFFALRPDRRLLRAAEIWSKNASYSETTGWSLSGFAPSGGNYVGAECGQGFFHTLFYKRKSLPVRRALAAAGLHGLDAPVGVDAAQLDLCIWNYQGGTQCPSDYDCELVQVHHKPTHVPEGRDCSKLMFRPGAPKKPSGWPSQHRPGNSPCEDKCISIGANCKCSGPNNVKTVTAPGPVHSCEANAMNPSGDTFDISFSGSRVTATRSDAKSCWCEEFLDVRCCVGKKGFAKKPEAG